MQKEIIMKKLLKNGTVLNVFTGELSVEDILIEGDRIIGVGSYDGSDADICEDLSGKFVCPGFIDGHIHIESTMLTPSELARACMPHGTTSIIADPHEIANVCGIAGIEYMLSASEGIPLHVYINLPSCVPATPFDESGAVLSADSLFPLYERERVIGLAEMMNYPGVIYKDPEVIKKLDHARSLKRHIDGHAPLLSGKELDAYVCQGISTDHECSNLDEAKEKLRKGQWIMIRQGTAARNLEALLPLFDPPFNHRCILVTDDRHPADIISEGHIDNIVRLAVKNGKSAITAIQMATVQAAQCFGLSYVGAVAPGYRADLLVLNNLDSVDIRDVYTSGVLRVKNAKMLEFATPVIESSLQDAVMNSFKLDELSAKDFYIEPKSPMCRVINILPGELVTEERIEEINWNENNGIDTERDILKLAVIERHKGTGHKGLGFIKGIGMKKGAIASSVSHDSHNLIVIGTNDTDMAIAAEHIRKHGGNAVVADGKVISHMPLPIAGLMADIPCSELAKANEEVRHAVYTLGVNKNVEPFMSMAFVSLAVIPSLKMITTGLFDVKAFKPVSLYANEK